jgi:integrase
MIFEKPTFTFFLDRSRPAGDGKCLIKFNIYSRPNKKRYSTIYHATPAQWEKLQGANLRDAELKKLRTDLAQLRARVEAIIEGIVPFSLVQFDDEFLGKSKSKERKSNALKEWFDDYIGELKNNGQVGSAKAYTDAYNSIDSYKSKLQLQDISLKFLNGYERHMRNLGRSPSTIGIYLRHLRAIINQAKVEKVIKADNYPFAGYTIPTSRNVKKALSDADLKKLLNHKTDDHDDQKALDFWIISYLCSGINFADLVELTPNNIQGEMLVFYRAKTKRTKKKDLKPIRVGMPNKAKDLVGKYQNWDSSNPYLFPILESGLPASTVKHRTQAFIKWVNARVKRIAEELGIESKVTTYAARHSFSTVLKRRGVSTEVIKDSLGHSSVATTENYLDSFSDEEMVKNANLLTDL